MTKTKENFIKECIEFGILESWNGKVRIFPNSPWMSIDDAVEKVEKFGVFDLLNTDCSARMNPAGSQY